ncbi:MAG: ATP-dependent helicase HrpB [Granulosicoccus sp.]|nr:ATP-dependent helicase HrpB [Granulosicoccus sp.]
MNLPIWQVVPQVIDALVAGNVLLQAEPGAGKSTGLPLALLQKIPDSKKIIMLEPRRLAARGVAARLAAQLGESVGQQIGLRMRGQTSVSKKTRLEVVTEGVLTRLLQADPALEGIGLVIFDEFHERSLHADLGLALCLEVQQALRDDLRLLLMSATLDSQQLANQLGNVREVHCRTRQHPVDITWLGEDAAALPQRAAKAVRQALVEQTGDMLVFLPGVAEIERTATLLQSVQTPEVHILRLHSGIGDAAQREATAPATPTCRRVILCTSIAETSITIEGVRVVVDSGLERRSRLDNNTGAARLETVTASQASATQRAGRAGRTAPGVCYRLWAKSGHSRRTAQWQPEILRADLTPVVMELGLWGATSSDELRWLDTPPIAAWSRAESLLNDLGVWHDGQLTQHGRRVAQLPVHPRLGHMLLWAARSGVTELACTLAVVLEESVRGSREIDLEGILQTTLPRHLKSRVDRLKNQVLQMESDGSLDRRVGGALPSIAIAVAQAFPDWIARRRTGADARYALSCGAGAILSIDDALARQEWLAIAQLGGSEREARIFAACALDIDELESFSPELFSDNRSLGWDDQAERVVAEDQVVLGQLIVSAKTVADLDEDDRAVAMLTGIRTHGLSCLPWTDECREWQARVDLMHSLPSSNSELKWPTMDDLALLGTLEEWLLPWLRGVGSLKALTKLDLLGVLKSMLDYRQQQALDALLPTHFVVPSGSRIRLRYRSGAHPVLAVKLQEMFGCVDNPSLAGGRVPITLELLSPARRPVQVTEDIANFWHSSYPDVKKDMAGRYPKHHWPDDPVNAIPTAKAKPRKR